jgi:hypothetical protein
MVRGVKVIRVRAGKLEIDVEALSEIIFVPRFDLAACGRDQHRFRTGVDERRAGPSQLHLFKTIGHENGLPAG